jgi:hypothetical protein
MNRIGQLFIIGIFLIFIISSCKKTLPVYESTFIKEPVPRAQIDSMIKESLQKNKSFEWSNMDVQIIWSALQHSDKIISIGYKPPYESNVEKRLSVIDIHQNEYAQNDND